MKKIETGPPLLLTLKPSRKLLQFNSAIHGLALIATFYSNVPWPVRLAVAAIVAANYWITQQRYNTETRIIEYEQRLGWQLTTNGIRVPVEISATTVISSLIIFLHIKGKPAQLIVHDALNEDEYRHLIVKLKLTIKRPSGQDNFS